MLRYLKDTTNTYAKCSEKYSSRFPVHFNSHQCWGRTVFAIQHRFAALFSSCRRYHALEEILLPQEVDWWNDSCHAITNSQIRVFRHSNNTALNSDNTALNHSFAYHSGKLFSLLQLWWLHWLRVDNELCSASLDVGSQMAPTACSFQSKPTEITPWASNIRWFSTTSSHSQNCAPSKNNMDTLSLVSLH